MRMDALSSAVAVSKLTCLPSKIRSDIKGKNLLPRGRVFSFSEEPLCAGMQTECLKSCLPCEKMAENLPSVLSTILCLKTGNINYFVHELIQFIFRGSICVG